MKLRSCFAVPALLALATVAGSDEAKKPETYQVPYRLSDTKHVVVRARINGKGPFNLVIDTGAPAFYLNKPTAKKLGVETDKEGWVTFERFELEGGLVIPKAKGRVESIFQIEGMNGMGVAGIELHGLLGYNVLAQYRIEYDFTRDKMTWTRLDFVPEMPQRLGGGAPPALDAMGTVMKMVGTFMGKNAQRDTTSRGFLGVELVEREGALAVQAVLPNSPAAGAGVQVGDQIAKVQDRDVASITDFQRALRKLRAGDTVMLTLRRNNTVKDISFTAGKGL